CSERRVSSGSLPRRSHSACGRSTTRSPVGLRRGCRAYFIVMDPSRRPMSSDPLELARSALSGREAWLVGGAVRDRQLGRPMLDVDVVLDGDPGEAARAVAATARAAG